MLPYPPQHSWYILLGFQNVLNSGKGRLRVFNNQKPKNEILKIAELEIKAIFIGQKLVMTKFLLFDIQTTVGPLEVYLHNLKSLQSLQNLPAFEAGFEAQKSAVFPRGAQNNAFLMSVMSVKTRGGRKMYHQTPQTLSS